MARSTANALKAIEERRKKEEERKNTNSQTSKTTNTKSNTNKSSSVSSGSREATNKTVLSSKNALDTIRKRREAESGATYSSAPNPSKPSDYSSTVKYLQDKGVQGASGIMTQREWQRRKGTSGGSYQDYLNSQVSKYDTGFKPEAKLENPVKKSTGEIILDSAGYAGEKLGRGVIDGLEGITDLAWSLVGAAGWGVTSGLGLFENSWSRGIENWYNDINENDITDYFGEAEKRYDAAPTWVKDAGWLPETIGNLVPFMAETALTGGTSSADDLLAAGGSLVDDAAKAGASWWDDVVRVGKNAVDDVGKTVTNPKKLLTNPDVHFGMSAGGNAIETAIDKGANPLTATAYGTASGALEVATEKLFGGYAGTGVGRATTNATKEIATNKKLLNKIWNSPVTKKALDIASEGIEEQIVAFGDPILQRAIGVDANAEWATWSDYVESGTHGVILSVVMNAVGIPIRKYGKSQAISSLNESTEVLNGLIQDETLKLQPLPNNATEDEIIARQKEVSAVAMAFDNAVKKAVQNEQQTTVEQPAERKTTQTNEMYSVLGDGERSVGIADGQAFVTNSKDIIPSPANRSVFLPVNDAEVAKAEFGATESSKTSANISKLLAPDSYDPIREGFVDGTLKGVGEVRVFTDENGREIALEKNVAEYFEGYNLEATFRGGKPYAIKATDNDGNVAGVAMAIWMDRSGQKYEITDAHTVSKASYAERNRTSTPTYERLEALSQNNEPISVADVKKATGFGEEGSKLVAELANNDGVTFSQAERTVKTAYMAGFSNVEGAKVNFESDTQINAFTAGKKDRAMQDLSAKENARKATVYDGVFTENEYTKNFTDAEKKMISIVAKSLGMDISVVDKIIANEFTGTEANAEHQDGKMRISSNRDADKLIHALVMHEGGHRMKQLAPTQFGVLMDALYERSVRRSTKSGVSQNWIFDNVKAQHDNAGITLDTSGYMEEFAVRELETIFSSAEEFNKWYAEMSGNQQVRTAWQKFVDFITELIEDIKNTLKQVTMSKAERAEARKSLLELERIKELLYDTYEASEHAVEARRKEAQAKQSVETKTETLSEATEQPVTRESKSANKETPAKPKNKPQTKNKAVKAGETYTANRTGKTYTITDRDKTHTTYTVTDKNGKTTTRKTTNTAADINFNRSGEEGFTKVNVTTGIKAGDVFTAKNTGTTYKIVSRDAQNTKVEISSEEGTKTMLISNEIADRNFNNMSDEGITKWIDEDMHIDNRSWEDVGDRKVKAFQFLFPEMQEYYRPLAQELLGDLDNTIQGERILTGSYELGNQEWTGVDRYTSDAIAQIKDATNASYDDIRNALNRLINDEGQENIALAKRIELVFDEMLTDGYNTFDGMKIPANEEYIAKKEALLGKSYEGRTEEAWDDDFLDDLVDFGSKNFSLKGTRKDGIEVYETSKDVMNMSVKDRKKLYVRLMSKDFLGRTARFVRNGHTYYAEFDRANLGKAMYGDNRSSVSGKKALTRVGADGDVFNLVENSTYDHSEADRKNHKKTDYFDYFIKTVQIDNKVYDLLADVKKQYGEKGGYVYTLVLTDNEKIKAAPAEVIENDAFKVAETTSTERQSVTSDTSSFEGRLSQNPKSVKRDFSLKDNDYLKAVKNGDMKTAQRMVEEAAKEAGYIGTYYHGSKSDFTVFKKEFGGASNSNASIGFWFTESEEGAKTWADESWWGDNEQSKVYKTYLRLNNPKVYESVDTKNQREELKKGYESIDKEMTLYDSIYYFDDGRRYHTERYDYDKSKRRSSGIYEWDAFKAIVKKYDTDTINFYLDKVSESEREIVKQDAERYLELSKERKALENQITELRYSDAYELFRTDMYKQIGMGAEDANIGGTGKYVENKDEMLKKYVDMLKQEGYDGIIIKGTSYDARFFGDNNNQYLVFDSNQAKSAEPVTYDDKGNVIPLSERFNTKSDDIRYSLKDSEGKSLTKEQQEYFKDSMVRDENGNLLVVYHGSPAKFTVFNHNKINAHGNAHGRGFYFTSRKSFAEGYKQEGGQLLKGYLNIANPLSEDKVTIKKADLLKLIKATCKEQAQEYVRDEGYDSVSDALRDTWISNYVDTYGTSIENAYREVADIIYRGNTNDVEMVAELTNAGAGTENTLRLVHDVLGYDGVIYENEEGHNEFVSLVSNQFKSVDNLNPTTNPDINFSLKEIKDKYADKTDHLYIYEKENTISIDNMVVKKEYRNQGIGTDILNDVIDYADRVQKTITLTPTSEFGTKERLKKWYKANGFVENKGRNTDFTISDTMYRLPSDVNFSLKGEVPHTELLDAIDDMRKGKKNAESRLYKYVEDGVMPTDLYEELIEKYGAITSGERPHRDVQVPRKSGKKKNVSQTVRTILEAKATPDEAVPTIEKMVEDGIFSYDVYTDKQALSDAEEYIQTYGWDESLDDWFDAVNKGEVSKELTTMGWALYNNAANIAATTTSESERTTAIKTSLKILDAMVRHQRSAAQALQATRILKKLSPETQLYGVQKSVQAFQNELAEKYGDKAPDLKIDEELAEQFINATTPEERAKIEEEIYKDIGRQMPSRFIDKWNAWRYLAMLGNLRTHGRNILGNAFFGPVVGVKNLTATAIESAVHRVSGKKTIRGKALVWGSKADRALLKAAWGDYGNVADMISNGGKYNDSAVANQNIQKGRQIFKFKPLEWARKKNSELLEREDTWFSKPHYAYALAQYCKANNITAEQIERGKAIAPAREYAIKEAQKATYRDTNAFSQMVSEWGRGNRNEKNVVKKAFNTVIEGILPFRKTPANILVRGVEYSPLGLLKGLSYDLVQVGKGKMTATEAIDNISAGLTGSGLLALGVYLAAQGLIRGHGEDEEEKEFKELMGHQSYALELPNGQSITLDWLAPEALPFFVGVNIWETSKGSEEEVNLSAILQSVSHISEPMLEMSCLQGLNDLFEGIGYASSNDTSGLVSVVSSAVTSYLTQGIPTLLGQAERTGEEERMSTYTEKDDFLTGDMQYTLGKASAKIPFWDYNQIPYIDAWGRREASGTKLKRGLNNFLNPAYTSTLESSKMEKELLRLYEQTGEGSVFPSRADKYFMVDGERKDLTAEEYVRYATLKGEKAYKLVSELVESKEYNNLSDSEKVKAIKDAYDYANQKAKESISNYKPEKWVNTADEFGSDAENFIFFRTNVSATREANGDKIEKEQVVDIISDIAQNDSEAWNMYLSMYDGKTALEAEEHGIDAKLFMSAVIDMGNIKADYKSNGKVISGSRRAKIERYLNSVCSSYKEYLFLLGTEYDSVKDDHDYVQYFGKE